MDKSISYGVSSTVIISASPSLEPVVTGASSTAARIIVTVAVLLSNDPSFALYVKVSVPL